MSGTVVAVVMGVAGAGKSAVGAALAARLGWAFTDADDLHSPANVARMRAGHPLDDAARTPWLAAVARWVADQEAAAGDAVLACSALRRGYRDAIRSGHPSVVFVHLEASAAVLAGRLAARRGHYMPASLLGSQLASLEPLGPDEPGLAVPADGTLQAVVDAAERAVRVLVSTRPESPS